MAVDVDVGRGQGEVFAGAGRSGGGEERVGDPFVEAMGKFFDSCSFSSSSFSASKLGGSGAAVASIL